MLNSSELVEFYRMKRELTVYKREFGKYTMECLACAEYGEVRPNCSFCLGTNIESALPLMESNEKLFKRQEKLIAKLEAVRKAAGNLLKQMAGKQDIADAAMECAFTLKAADEFEDNLHC
jgi:hypothetical protein